MHHCTRIRQVELIRDIIENEFAGRVYWPEGDKFVYLEFEFWEILQEALDLYSKK